MTKRIDQAIIAGPEAIHRELTRQEALLEEQHRSYLKAAPRSRFAVAAHITKTEARIARLSRAFDKLVPPPEPSLSRESVKDVQDAFRSILRERHPGYDFLPVDPNEKRKPGTIRASLFSDESKRAARLKLRKTDDV